MRARSAGLVVILPLLLAWMGQGCGTSESPAATNESAKGGTGGKGGGSGKGGSGGGERGGSGGDERGGSGGDESGGAGGSSGAAGASGAGGAVGPGQCRDVVCDRPACCGDACTPGSCCAGTICSVENRCIPDFCRFCGDVACGVDFDSCTAQCTTPTCCMQACVDENQCCTGTSCTPDGSGQRICAPQACDACGGMTPICRITEGTCAIECAAPDTCGRACTGNPECGPASYCHQFPSGNRYCVPEEFDRECAACGETCGFYLAECQVFCHTAQLDGGVAGASGAGGALDGGVDGSGVCQPCCAPCGPGAACCDGSSCQVDPKDRTLKCVPNGCSACRNGCSFACP